MPPMLLSHKKSEIPQLGFAEFISLTAMMMSLVALSVDTMLPALSEIGRDLGASDNNRSQLIISLFFFGMAAGQLLYGPVSDHTGRKPAIYLGYGLFITGCLLSLFATNLNVMLAGRFLQGFGTAGPRIVSIAIVRDRYEGSAMARVMSFVMTVFIIVPIIAPALGQGMLLLAGWRAIFASFLILALLTLVWFILRQPETLSKEKRVPFSFKRIISTVMIIFGNRSAMGYTVTAGLVFGFFLGYLKFSAADFSGRVWAWGRVSSLFCLSCTLDRRRFSRQCTISAASHYAVAFKTCAPFNQRTLIRIFSARAVVSWATTALDAHGISLCNIFRHWNTFRESQCTGHGVSRKNRRYWSRCSRLALNLHLTHCRHRHWSELQRNRSASHGRFFHAQPGVARSHAMGGQIDVTPCGR